MSLRLPDDTVTVLQTLVNESKRSLPDLHMPQSLLLGGAIIDAENLLAEIASNEKNREVPA